MVCPRCGRENDPSNQFCGRCGLEFAQVVKERGPDPDFKPCYRHPKELTGLSCGRCERPICTRCVKIGPAGPRCPECAKHNVPITARGVAHDLSKPLKGMARQGPFAIYWWFLIAMLVFGGFRGCAMMNRQPPPSPPIEREQPASEGDRV